MRLRVLLVDAGRFMVCVFFLLYVCGHPAVLPPFPTGRFSGLGGVEGAVFGGGSGGGLDGGAGEGGAGGPGWGGGAGGEDGRLWDWETALLACSVVFARDAVTAAGMVCADAEGAGSLLLLSCACVCRQGRATALARMDDTLLAMHSRSGFVTCAVLGRGCVPPFVWLCAAVRPHCSES